MAVLNVNIPEFYECFTGGGGVWEIVMSPSYPMFHSSKFKCISNPTHSTHVPFKLWEGGGAEMVKTQMDIMNRVDEKNLFKRDKDQTSYSKCIRFSQSVVVFMSPLFPTQLR